MHAYGISIDNECAVAVAQTYHTILLLEPAKQKSERDTDKRTYSRNHTSFKKKDANNLLIGGSEITQCYNIGLFIDDKHR